MYVDVLVRVMRLLRTATAQVLSVESPLEQTQCFGLSQGKVSVHIQVSGWMGVWVDGWVSMGGDPDR